VNPLLGFDENHNRLPEIDTILKKFPGAIEVTNEDGQRAFKSSTFFYRAKTGIPPRPMFLHDAESKTQEQLNNFVKREMSLLLRQAIRANYSVEGHSQETPENGRVVWTPDTMVHVVDDAAGLDEEMYVLGAHYNKSRTGGTTTSLSLILKNSIAF
jgi:prophage tail gpP-like protein